MYFLLHRFDVAPGVDVLSLLSTVIADDHKIIRDAVRRALIDTSHDFEFDVVAEVENGLDAVVAVREYLPDLLILDISMPLASGAEIVQDVLHWSPDTRILVLTGIVAPGLLASMVNAGVHGVFSKTAPVESLQQPFWEVARSRGFRSRARLAGVGRETRCDRWRAASRRRRCRTLVAPAAAALSRLWRCWHAPSS